MSRLKTSSRNLLTSAAPDDTIAVAHRNHLLLPMYDACGGALFQQLPFDPSGVKLV